MAVIHKKNFKNTPNVKINLSSIDSLSVVYDKTAQNKLKIEIFDSNTNGFKFKVNSSCGAANFPHNMKNFASFIAIGN